LNGGLFCFPTTDYFEKNFALNQSSVLRLITFLTGPLVFLVVAFVLPAVLPHPAANKTLGVGLWMIIWWVTEAAPIPVTALIPLVAFPFLGVMDISKAAAAYANHIIFLFMGGFLIAIALEKHRLHERIALKLIKITGTSGNGIILGFMIATGGISMWISNTATAMMMLPIATSVIDLLREKKDQPIHEMDKGERNFALSLLLMVGYAATLGGLATLIGTPPNVVFAGLLDEYYHEKVNFGKWMLVGVPISIATLLATYFILTRILFPNRIAKVKGTDALLKEKLAELGPVSGTEKRVMAIFLMTSILWIFQQPINEFILKGDLLNDTNVAMLGGLLMFVVPADARKFEFILDWNDTQHLQWGILILFGGGLCLASGLQNAGIIQQLGKWIAEQSSFNTTMILALIVITVLLSEFMSNVALVQIFIPVIFGISQSLNINPFLLGIPVTLAASIGFMFPIATPPNAIVFSSGYIRMKDMIKAGILLDIACILLILLGSVTLVATIFNNGN
jgi:solute carrier family 13 (sodium-dependent dicarboxylate transporter), member 2/3/5